MEKVRLWCGQPTDRGRLKNRTELTRHRADDSARRGWYFPAGRAARVWTARSERRADVRSWYSSHSRSATSCPLSRRPTASSWRHRRLDNTWRSGPSLSTKHGQQLRRFITTKITQISLTAWYTTNKRENKASENQWRIQKISKEHAHIATWVNIWETWSQHWVQEVVWVN